MKFCRYNNTNYLFFYKIKDNNLTAIYQNSNFEFHFYKNSKFHNSKNAAYINNDGYKEFWLNNKRYGYQKDFTKSSWRKFIKMQVFL